MTDSLDSHKGSLLIACPGRGCTLLKERVCSLRMLPDPGLWIETQVFIFFSQLLLLYSFFFKDMT